MAKRILSEQDQFMMGKVEEICNRLKKRYGKFTYNADNPRAEKIEGDERAHFHFFIKEEMKAGVSFVLDAASNVRLEFSTNRPSSIENPDDTLMCLNNLNGTLNITSRKNRGMFELDNDVEKYADWIWENEVESKLRNEDINE